MAQLKEHNLLELLLELQQMIDEMFQEHKRLSCNLHEQLHQEVVTLKNDMFSCKQKLENFELMMVDQYMQLAHIRQELDNTECNKKQPAANLEQVCGPQTTLVGSSAGGTEQHIDVVAPPMQCLGTDGLFEETWTNLPDLSRGSLSLSSGSRSLASSSSTLERRLGGNEHQLALRDIQLAEHDLKIQMLEATTYDGTFIWKIDEFSRRHHEAIIGKTSSIYSPPFYVGRSGYKACARVYPNGDGMGKETHLSLFFVIMKGEYDALNPWPFRQKVTFKLLDHDRQNDISDTFRPDPKSPSFKRPTSNMNIASGCPLFVSQQDLQSRSYVNDDTLFIKIAVDTTGLPPLGF